MTIQKEKKEEILLAGEKNDRADEVINKTEVIEKSEFTKYFFDRNHELAFYFKSNQQIFDVLIGVKPIHKARLARLIELKKYYLKMFHPDKHIGSDDGLDYNEICSDIDSTFNRIMAGLIKNDK